MYVARSMSDGLIIAGDAFDHEVQRKVALDFQEFKLIICDPPYGKISGESWDVADYHRWFAHCAHFADHNGATICMWGGVGKRGHRPFIEFAADVEDANPSWEIKNWITWGKKRAYGVKDNYLFTREECLILVRGRPVFNIPLLEKLRGYAGYDAAHPAKSEFLRRTNVWTDVTELLRGKIHPTQKPDRLYEVLVKAHSNPGDAVYDPCAGSGTTARACRAANRRFCIVERERKYLVAAGLIAA